MQLNTGRYMSIIVFGKIKGTYDKSNHTYFSDRDIRHWFHKFNGLGLSFSLIMRLRKLGCKRVCFNYKRKDGGEDLYIADIDDFVEKGHRYRNTEHDVQFILSKKDFQVIQG